MKLTRLCLTGAMIAASTAASAAVIPFGLQAGVSQATVSSWGWSECSRTATTAITSIAGVLSACDGDYLMMGVWDASAGNYGVLGAGEFSVVSAITYANSGSDNGGTTLDNWSNGLNFYRTASYGSWGFTTGTKTELNSADIFLLNGLQAQNGQVEDVLSAGLSFHIDGASLTSGWAFNPTGSDHTSMVSGDQRVFFVANAGNDVPEPGVLSLAALGLAGLGLAKRRKH